MTMEDVTIGCQVEKRLHCINSVISIKGYMLSKQKEERNENHTISSVSLWYFFFLSCSFILRNTF